MIDIEKILEIVDADKEVFLAREDKPMIVIMPIDKYNKLNKEVEPGRNGAMSKIDVNDNYIDKVRKSLLDD